MEMQWPTSTYNFETMNNLGIVYDESKYTNFLELVPKDYVKWKINIILS